MVLAFLAIIPLILGCNVLAQYPPPQVVTGNTSIADPTICKDNAGTYFLFGTGTGIEIRTSPDCVAWTYVGSMWPNGAPWTNPYTGSTPGVLWAPDCTYHNGEFIVYYSASSLGSQNSAIFLARSTTGMPGSFTNEGLVKATSSALDYNAIDPNLLISGNSWRLSLGSFWTGIKQFDVNPNTGLLLQGDATSPTSLAERFVNNKAIGTSVVFQYGKYYYLFVSWDFCCQGVQSTENIRVGRSKTTSGFVDQNGIGLINGGGSLVLQTHDNIIGTGSPDFFNDTDGVIMAYQYYTPAGSFLGLNRLDFSTGWPVVQAT